jgi:hypothetical protein
MMTYRNDIMRYNEIEKLMARGRTERSLAIRGFFARLFSRRETVVRHPDTGLKAA